MKTLTLLTSLLIMLTPIIATHGQSSDGFYLIYGNPDGSTIDVNLDSDIEIEVWAVTNATDGYYDPECECIIYGASDSINFMHNPLSSDNFIITSRNGGIFHEPFYLWDDTNFLPPDQEAFIPHFWQFER